MSFAAQLLERRRAAEQQKREQQEREAREEAERQRRREAALNPPVSEASHAELAAVAAGLVELRNAAAAAAAAAAAPSAVGVAPVADAAVDEDDAGAGAPPLKAARTEATADGDAAAADAVRQAPEENDAAAKNDEQQLPPDEQQAVDAATAAAVEADRAALEGSLKKLLRFATERDWQLPPVAVVTSKDAKDAKTTPAAPAAASAGDAEDDVAAAAPADAAATAAADDDATPQPLPLTETMLCGVLCAAAVAVGDATLRGAGAESASVAADTSVFVDPPVADDVWASAVATLIAVVEPPPTPPEEDSKTKPAVGAGTSRRDHRAAAVVPRAARSAASDDSMMSLPRAAPKAPQRRGDGNGDAAAVDPVVVQQSRDRDNNGRDNNGRRPKKLEVIEVPRFKGVIMIRGPRCLVCGMDYIERTGGVHVQTAAHGKKLSFLLRQLRKMTAPVECEPCGILVASHKLSKHQSSDEHLQVLSALARQQQQQQPQQEQRQREPRQRDQPKQPEQPRPVESGPYTTVQTLASLGSAAAQVLPGLREAPAAGGSSSAAPAVMKITVEGMRVAMRRGGAALCKTPAFLPAYLRQPFDVVCRRVIGGAASAATGLDVPMRAHAEEMLRLATAHSPPPPRRRIVDLFPELAHWDFGRPMVVHVHEVAFGAGAEPLVLAFATDLDGHLQLSHHGPTPVQALRELCDKIVDAFGRHEAKTALLRGHGAQSIAVPGAPLTLPRPADMSRATATEAAQLQMMDRITETAAAAAGRLAALCEGGARLYADHSVDAAEFHIGVSFIAEMVRCKAIRVADS